MARKGSDPFFEKGVRVGFVSEFSELAGWSLARIGIVQRLGQRVLAPQMVVRIHLPILLFPRSQSEPGGSRCSAVGRRPCPFDRASLDRTRFGLETLMVRLAAAAGAVLRFQPSVCRVRFFVAVLVLLGEWPSLVTASALGAEDREFESLLPDNIPKGSYPFGPKGV